MGGYGICHWYCDWAIPRWGVDRRFSGIIDELRIYNRVLSDAEILELYNSCSLEMGDADGSGLRSR